MNSNEKKRQQLGMPLGTAACKLRKAVMFDLARRLGEDICYRCNMRIGSAEDFSIDHRKPWLDSDPALFWDLDNIAFSHWKCNTRAHRQRAFIHGKASSYCHSGCRCRACTDAHAASMREWRSV